MSVDLSRNTPEASLADRRGEFELAFEGGKILRFRAASRGDAADWVEALRARVAFFCDLRDAERRRKAEADDDDDDDDDDDENAPRERSESVVARGDAIVAKEGWVSKLSDKRHVGWQKRWLSLKSGGELSYGRDKASGAKGVITGARDVAFASACAPPGGHSSVRDSLRAARGARFRWNSRPVFL